MNGIRGRRIHISGSASDDINIKELLYAHDIIGEISKKILESGGGLVITLGEEPKHKHDQSVSTIFDWTVLESLKSCIENRTLRWPESQGAPVVAIGFGNALERIPSERINLFNDVRDSGCIDIHFLNYKLNIGGLLRQKQEIYGDILLTFGGGPGVNHLAQIYMNSKKHVVPLDLDIKNKNNASKELNQKALQNPSMFFEYTPETNAASAFSRLSLKDKPNPEEFWGKLQIFFNHLRKPKAFLVRLQNKKHCCYREIEKYIRNVVEPVIQEMGYETYEVGREVMTEGFMNVEIFNQLHYSSLVIADLTGLRSNCLVELGYSLGMMKKTIITANKSTLLPWDVNSIHCHLWEYELDDEERKKRLKDFLRININKRPIVQFQEVN